MSAKGEGRSQVYAQIVGDVVEVHPTKKTGSTISFDKEPTLVSIVEIRDPHTWNQCLFRLASVIIVLIGANNARRK